jgi:hypothetical protein
LKMLNDIWNNHCAVHEFWKPKTENRLWSAEMSLANSGASVVQAKLATTYLLWPPCKNGDAFVHSTTAGLKTVLSTGWPCLAEQLLVWTTVVDKRNKCESKQANKTFAIIKTQTVELGWPLDTSINTFCKKHWCQLHSRTPMSWLAINRL